jgi:hypothetical protein
MCLERWMVYGIGMECLANKGKTIGGVMLCCQKVCVEEKGAPLRRTQQTVRRVGAVGFVRLRRNNKDGVRK